MEIGGIFIITIYCDKYGFAQTYRKAHVKVARYIINTYKTLENI